jgi:hypothetical protein
MAGRSCYGFTLLRPVIVAGVVVLLAAGAMILAGTGPKAAAGLSSGHWVAAAMTSRLSIVCFIVTGVCALLLSAILAMLWRAGARGRSGRSRSGQDGNAALEFALALPFALMLVLLMAQSSLLMGGNLCVHYAAYCAARSAIVQVPSSDGQELPNMVSDPAFSGKMARIKQAAVWAVMPVSCGDSEIQPSQSVGVTELQNALNGFFSQYGQQPPTWIADRLTRKFSYADEYTTVTMDPPVNPPKYRPYGRADMLTYPNLQQADYSPEDLTVRVQHTLYLPVPYAAWLFAKASADGVALDFGHNEYGMNINVSCMLTNEGMQDYVDVEPFPRESGRQPSGPLPN